MGNQALIRGAELAAPKFNDIGAAVKAGTKDFVQVYEAIANEKKQEQRNQKAKVEAYLNNMPANVELAKIPVAQQGMVATWSKDLKMKYAEAARVLPSLEPGSEEAIDARNVMDSVKQAFTNANNNFVTFQTNKNEYLTNSDKNLLSEGNNLTEGNLLANIYTEGEGSDMVLDENGNLGFKSGDGKILNLNDVPDYFNKDFKTSTALSKLNESIYNSGEKLDETTYNFHENKIILMIEEGGRETVLSMAMDNVIQKGGLGIVDQDLLYNPDRENELAKVVVDSYMKILNNSANIGFQKKQSKIQQQLLNQSKTQETQPFVKYGQATTDDLNVYEEPATTAFSDLTRQLKDINEMVLEPKDIAEGGNTTERKVKAINDVMANINNGWYDLVIAGREAKRKERGKVFTRGEDGKDYPIDITILDDSNKLIDFIVNNMGKGIGDDAKMILKRKLKGGGDSNRIPINGNPNML